MPAKPRPDNTLIRALARAHRWKGLLEARKYQSAAELAEVEDVTRSFVNRLLRLTLLAPDIVEAILDGRQPKAASRRVDQSAAECMGRAERTPSRAIDVAFAASGHRGPIAPISRTEEKRLRITRETRHSRRSGKSKSGPWQYCYRGFSGHGNQGAAAVATHYCIDRCG